MGKNMFLISYRNKNGSVVTDFASYASNWNCNYVDNRDLFISECKKDDGSGTHAINSAQWCGELIYCNNWKIPNDYPIKF